MQRTPSTRNAPWDNDQIVTAVIGALALGAVLGSAGMLWDKALAWLVSAEVLVAAEQGPVWALPASGGAGLDWPRPAILVGVVLTTLAVTASAARRSWAKREVAE